MRNWLVGVAAAAVIALGGVGVGAYVANQNDPLNQVLQAGDVRQATVEVTGGGTATVSISPSKDAIVVKMNNVPAPPAGQGLPDVADPEGRLGPGFAGPDGRRSTVQARSGQGHRHGCGPGITVEPAGGSASPTTPTVAAATARSLASGAGSACSTTTKAAQALAPSELEGYAWAATARY